MCARVRVRARACACVCFICSLMSHSVLGQVKSRLQAHKVEHCEEPPRSAESVSSNRLAASFCDAPHVVIVRRFLQFPSGHQPDQVRPTHFPCGRSFPGHMDFRRGALEFNSDTSTCEQRGQMSNLVLDSVKDLTAAQFSAWLRKHGVDVSRFGQGAAKTIEDFLRLFMALFMEI